ncbi:hypothetical protein BH09ACT12_BH09ACT12_01400 [soil metagenome]
MRTLLAALALAVTLAVTLGVALAGCAGEADPAPDAVADSEATPAPTPSPSPTLRTIPALPVVTAPPTGLFSAVMQQSSIDVSRGQFQVIVVNDTTHDLDPTAVRFRDPRFAGPLVGGNLRVDPSRSQRGYPFALPERPDCTRPRAQVTSYVVVDHAGGRERVPVDDETDVVGRFLDTRCQELAIAEVATLRWSDRVPVDHPGLDCVGTLTLIVAPTGAPGHTLTIDGVNGSHLLGSADDPSGWTPALTVTSDGSARRIGLPLKPTRCDDHAFMEGGNATAFRVRFTLDGAAGEILLRMTPRGSSAALHYAQDSCGLG